MPLDVIEIDETGKVHGPTFRGQLEDLINRHSLENSSNTPDFILADYLLNCLAAFDAAVKARDDWYRSDVEETEEA